MGLRHTEFAWVAALLLTLPVAAAALPPSPRAAALALNADGPSSIFLNETAVYWANVTGGAPPYTFAWSVNGTAVDQNISEAFGSERFTLRPVVDSSFLVKVVVNDSLNVTAAWSKFLSVEGVSPVSVAVSGLPSTINSTVSVSATVRGGTPPYSYLWNGPGAPTGWTSVHQFTSTSLPSGTYTFGVVVRDAYGYSGSSSITVKSQVTESNGLPDLWLWVALGVTAGTAGMLALLVVRRRRAPPRL